MTTLTTRPAARPSPPELVPAVQLGQVTSVDGTSVGYRRLGAGPGLVILHGGGRASQHYLRLAAALADRYTVYLPDRRGRGLTGPAGAHYSFAAECQDLGALLQATGARRLFGHSAGAVIALEAALGLPIDQLAVYEPPNPLTVPLDWLPAFEQALARGDSVAALGLFFKGLRLNWLSALPGWVIRLMVKQLLREPEGREMAALLPTVSREFHEALRLQADARRYQAVAAPTLVLAGRRSPAYLREAARELAGALPHAQLLEFPDFDHNAPDQHAPQAVAAALDRFFAPARERA